MKVPPFVVNVQNRRVMAPLSLHFSQLGAMSLDEVHFIIRQAQSCGMIIIGSHAIAGSTLAYPNGWELTKTLQAEAFQLLLRLCRERNIKLGIQLYFHDPTADFRSWGDEEFQAVLLHIADALKECGETGIDFVELHGANSFLIHRLLSPIYNQHSGRWGAEERLFLRLLLKVVASVQRDLPRLEVGIRLVPEEMAPGYSFDDFLQMIDQINESTLSYVHLSTRCWNQVSCTGELIVEKTRHRLKPSIALIGSGAIFDADEASSCLRYTDLVSIGKPLLTPVEVNPELPVSSKFLDQIKQQLIRQHVSFLGFSLTQLPIIAGPMSTMSAHDNGTFSLEEKRLYSQIAQLADVILLGATGISHRSASVPRGNRLADQVSMYSHRSLVQLVQRFKTKQMIVQLYHGGEYAQQLSEEEKQSLLTISSDQLTDDELSEVILEVFNEFRRSVRYAVCAGFSAVELNLSDPYLLYQWAFATNRLHTKRQLLELLVKWLAVECRAHQHKKIALGIRFSVTDLTTAFLEDRSFGEWLKKLLNHSDYVSINSSDYRHVTTQWVIEKMQQVTKGERAILLSGRVRNQRDIQRLAYKGVFAMMVRPFIFSEQMSRVSLNSTLGYQINQEHINKEPPLPKGLAKSVQENKDWYIDK